MTPRKEEVPREKPWLWRRTAMISSSRLILSMHSVRSAYLHGGDRQSETIQGPKRDQLFQGDAVYALRQVRVPARGNTSGLAMYVLQLRSMLRLQLDSTSTASASSGLKLAESARSGLQTGCQPRRHTPRRRLSARKGVRGVLQDWTHREMVKLVLTRGPLHFSAATS